MHLNPIKWKTKTLAYVILGTITLYIFFVYKWTHYLTFEAVIKNSKPQQVWEFVADFSNMKKLNPSLEEFEIIDESGNFDHWKYSVQYTEHLIHAPLIKNTAIGNYSVKTKDNGFLIKSLHKTCFLLGFSCLTSESEFHFEARGDDTQCREVIQYECPLAFSNFCQKETMVQRNEVLNNLKSHFLVNK